MLVVTYIRLRNPLKFFTLSAKALGIMRQAKSSPGNQGFKNTGFWLDHYTMTLWDSKDDAVNFAKAGAHKEAMKISGEISSEIRTAFVDQESFLSWKDAKKALEEGKVLRFK